jgi:hypothetical protein
LWRRRGLSLTSFVLDAARKAADEMEAGPGLARVKRRGPSPLFFEALCRESSRDGASNYANVGHELRGRVRRLDGDGNKERIDRLRDALEPWCDDGILAWFGYELLQCPRLIPPRRRRRIPRRVLRGACGGRQDSGLLNVTSWQGAVLLCCSRGQPPRLATVGGDYNLPLHNLNLPPDRTCGGRGAARVEMASAGVRRRGDRLARAVLARLPGGCAAGAHRAVRETRSARGCGSRVVLCGVAMSARSSGKGCESVSTGK